MGLAPFCMQLCSFCCNLRLHAVLQAPDAVRDLVAGLKKVEALGHGLVAQQLQFAALGAPAARHLCASRTAGSQAGQDCDAHCRRACQPGDVERIRQSEHLGIINLQTTPVVERREGTASASAPAPGSFRSAARCASPRGPLIGSCAAGRSPWMWQDTLRSDSLTALQWQRQPQLGSTSSGIGAETQSRARSAHVVAGQADVLQVRAHALEEVQRYLHAVLCAPERKTIRLTIASMACICVLRHAAGP